MRCFSFSFLSRLRNFRGTSAFLNADFVPAERCLSRPNRRRWYRSRRGQVEVDRSATWSLFPRSLRTDHREEFMHEKRTTKQRIVRVTGQQNAQHVIANLVRRMASVSKKEKKRTWQMVWIYIGRVWASITWHSRKKWPTLNIESCHPGMKVRPAVGETLSRSMDLSIHTSDSHLRATPCNEFSGALFHPVPPSLLK